MRFYLHDQELVFEDDSQYPAKRPVLMQQVIDRTAAGTVQVETYALPLRRRTLNFAEMGKTDHDNLLNWYVNIVNGMELTFNFEDERGENFVVRFITPNFALQETSFARYSGSMELEIIQ